MRRRIGRQFDHEPPTSQEQFMLADLEWKYENLEDQLREAVEVFRKQANLVDSANWRSLVNYAFSERAGGRPGAKQVREIQERMFEIEEDILDLEYENSGRKIEYLRPRCLN